MEKKTKLRARPFEEQCKATDTGRVRSQPRVLMGSFYWRLEDAVRLVGKSVRIGQLKGGNSGKKVNGGEESV